MAVRTTYSKPLADISAMTQAEIANNETNLAIQRAGAAMLADRPDRAACLLCDAPLTAAEGFMHRGVGYRLCSGCGHVQSRARPPDSGFPPTTFETVYPPLDRAAAEARVERVYRPKLDWALAQADLLNTDRAGLLARRWFEIGCGAGYFLKALTDAGAGHIGGTDHEARLAARAVEFLGRPVAKASPASFAETVRANPADIYVAWFVLEHIEAAGAAWRALRDCPPGTLFLFSVPMLGLATLLEGAVDGVAARNLDNAVHVQLYSERSLAHAMAIAGLEPVAEWLFGQDIEDLLRVLAVRLADNPAAAAAPALGRMLGQLAQAADALQGAVDRARLCDARHILARRT